MTEKEVEMAYKKMAESDAPDLWARVESNLPEKEIQPEMKVKKGFLRRSDRYFPEAVHGKHPLHCAQSASLYMAQLRVQAVCSEQAHLMERLRQHQKAVMPWMLIQWTEQKLIQQRVMVQKLHRPTITA